MTIYLSVLSRLESIHLQFTTRPRGIQRLRNQRQEARYVLQEYEADPPKRSWGMDYYRLG